MKVKPRKHYDVVIVRSDAIGDFVIWMSTLSFYRKRFQGKSILLICPKADKELAEIIGVFDEILTFDRKRIENQLFYNVKYMFSIKKISADVVINPTWQHHMSADYICALIKSPQKIGTNIKRNGIRARWCNRYFTKLVEMPDPHNASEFEAIECFTQKVIDVSYKYTLSDFSNITNDYDDKIKKMYCVISLSSSSEIRNWPIERLAVVLSNIPNNLAIVLSGYGEKDVERAEFIIREDHGNHDIYNYVDRTTIIELVGLISKSAFVLGNDSAAVHIAAACRVRSLCFTPGAHFKRFVPYPDFIPEKEFHPRSVYYEMNCFRCDYNCIMKKKEDGLYPCLDNITIEMVNEELANLINELNDSLL